jgi:adenylosuccinate synthase
MTDVILGLQWGDEGKGKVADYLTPKYDVIARFQGGPNAGHSIEFNGKKAVLNTIPSGIFHSKSINIIGNGVVVDPVRIKAEIERVELMGANPKGNIVFSRKASIIIPTHTILDMASEFAKGDRKIGSTLRGIGPVYRDKYGRASLRLGDIFAKDFRDKYQHLRNKHLQHISFYGFEDFELEPMETAFFEAIEFLKSFRFDDTEYLIRDLQTEGKKILAEGAQGSMLDIDFGSYPFVTSSNTISGGVCTGLGIAPTQIRQVYGIFKAYCTRVGSGPFPTELDNDQGEWLRQKGNEFGATTGRPRRCGWLDLVALKYAIMLSGVNQLIMMKSDVLSGLDHIQVCTGYEIDGMITDKVPSNMCTTSLTPVYHIMDGWKEDISGITTLDSLPATFREYIRFIEHFTGVPIVIISVGPDRDQTIISSALS